MHVSEPEIDDTETDIHDKTFTIQNVSPSIVKFIDDSDASDNDNCK